MTMLTPARFVRGMKHSSLVLQSLLRNMPQAQAVAARDGAEGWNIVEIICHLRDWEDIFFQRANRMLTENNPILAAVDHDALVREHHCAEQDLQAVLADFVQKRAAFMDWFKARTPEEMARIGQHPEAGQITIFEQAVQIVTHDLNHIEQIMHTLDAHQA